MTPGPSPSRTSFLEAAGQSEKRGENGTGLGGEKTLWPRNRRSGHKRRLVEASRPTRAEADALRSSQHCGHLAVLLWD